MADYYWAGITASFLATWGALNSRKGRYLRRHDSNLGRMNFGLFLLFGWASLNFAGNLVPLKDHAGGGLIVLLDSVAIAFLLGAGVLMAVSWTQIVRGIRNRLARDKGLRFAVEMSEAVSRIPVDNGSLDFLNKATEILADCFLPEFYCISGSRDAGGLNIYAQYKIDYDPEANDGHKFIAVDSGETNHLKDKSSGASQRKIEIAVPIVDEEYKLSFYNSALSKGHFTEKCINYLSTILSSRMQSAVYLEKSGAKMDSLDLQNRLYSLGRKSSDLASYLKDIFYAVSERFTVDYISIAVIDSTIQNMYRYTYAEVGGSLVERGICYPLKQTVALKVARGRKMMIANTLGSDFYRDDYHLYKSGFSSRLVYPLCDETERVKGILTLAAVKPRAFNNLAEESLDFFSLPLCRMIEMHNITSMMNSLKKQVVSSFNLTFGLENSEGLSDFYDRSARILAETLPATMCRIWGLNRQNNSLESIGFYSLRGKMDKIPSDFGKIDLELMPRHKAAILMGKAIIVNQSNPEYSMDKSEIKVMGLPGMKSAILAPMRLQNRVFGIVSVGELRNWERRSLGQQELLYSQIISTIAALVREIDHKSADINRLKSDFGSLEKKSQIYDTYPNLPSKISSSLSSLLGAAQLIRQKLPGDAPELIRYNEIILKGAEIMMKEFKKFEEIRNSLE